MAAWQGDSKGDEKGCHEAAITESHDISAKGFVAKLVIPQVPGSAVGPAVNRVLCRLKTLFLPILRIAASPTMICASLY